MTSVREHNRSTQRNQAFKAPTSSSSNKSDNRDYKDPLRWNEFWSSKVLAEPEALIRPEAPVRPYQALFLPIAQDPDVNQYSQ